MEWVWIQWVMKFVVIPLIAVMWISLSRKVDKSMNRELCDQRHYTLKSRLDGDDTKFDKITEKLDVIKELVIKLDTMSLNKERNE